MGVEEIPTERHFGWRNMFVAPDDDPRSPARTFGERATLTGSLRDYRTTLELKCADLDAEQLACRSVPPSDLLLLGLVRYMADVEHFWFRRVLGGEDVEREIFGNDDNRDAAFGGVRPDPVAVEEAWATWRREVVNADRFVERSADLARTGTMPDGGELSLREVLVHMVEEYARHCGHADLLRERIDGRVGL